MGLLLDELGSFMGQMAARMQEIQTYKSEYEGMSDYDLKREYNDLKGKRDSESQNRLKAVKMVLTDRGYFQGQN